MAVTSLRGCSWDHPRGHAPMVATAGRYAELTGGAVQIEWVPRSLREFGMASVEELATEYDLIVMDHPHIGLVAESGCAAPLDDLLEEADLAALAVGSPGRSHQSYEYGGRQWALAIDAACQASAWRPDLIEVAPRTWAEVLELSRQGRVLWPLCDVDAAASLMTIAASLGQPVAESEERFAERETARRALALMSEVAAHSDRRCLSANPIDALEAMTSSDQFVYSPLLFCYVSYSRRDRAGRRVRYGPIPVEEGHQPGGALLGGAGLVVSALRPSTDEAGRYAAFVASAGSQTGVYFDSGGQPAHAAAWGDSDLDERSGAFFSSLGAVMGSSWTRPRWPAFAGFQNEMIGLFTGWFDRGDDHDALLDRLEQRFRAARGRSEARRA